MVFQDSSTRDSRLVVLGAGNWGTTIASLFAPSRPTVLLTRTAEQANLMVSQRINKSYLPDFTLPDSLIISSVDAFTIEERDVVFIAVPSHRVREAVEPLKEQLKGGLVVNGAKGFDHSTLKTMSELLIELLPDTAVVTFSGPNIAREIAAGKPTRAVLAGKRLEALSRASRMLSHPRLTLETSRDVRGVEIAASLKGILAITIGMADELELGDNFNGLLMTYGLREFLTLATFLGASESTVYGIAGLGDLVTSSLSPAGRNRKFGQLLASGTDPDTALGKVGMVVEGVEMLKTVTKLQELNISLPLFTVVRDIIEAGGEHAREKLTDAVLHYGTPISTNQKDGFAVE